MVEANRSIEINVGLNTQQYSLGVKNVRDGLKDTNIEVKRSKEDLDSFTKIANAGIGIFSKFGTAALGALTGIAAMAPSLSGVMAEIGQNIFQISDKIGKALKPEFEGLKNAVAGVNQSLSDPSIANFVSEALKIGAIFGAGGIVGKFLGQKIGTIFVGLGLIFEGLTNLQQAANAPAGQGYTEAGFGGGSLLGGAGALLAAGGATIAGVGGAALAGLLGIGGVIGGLAGLRSSRTLGPTPTLGGILAGAGTGAVIGAAFGGIGAIPGAIIGGLAGLGTAITAGELGYGKQKEKGILAPKTQNVTINNNIDIKTQNFTPADTNYLADEIGRKTAEKMGIYSPWYPQ